MKRTNVKCTKRTLAKLARLGKTPMVYDMNGHPKFKSKRKGDFSFYQDTAKIQITDTHVKLESISTSRRRNRQRLNWIKLAEVDRIPVGVKYENPRISFDGLNWWLSISVEFEPEQVIKCGDSLGIDLGVKNLAVCSDGTVYPNINKTRQVKNLERRMRRLQRSLARKYFMNEKEDNRYCKTCNIIRSEKTFIENSPQLSC